MAINENSISKAIRNLNAAVTDVRARIDVLAQASQPPATVSRGASDAEIARYRLAHKLQEWEWLELISARTIPFSYTIPINLALGTTARTPGAVQTMSRGYFIFKRVYFTWRTTADGHFHGITSRDNVAADANVINFAAEYESSDSERNRQNTAIPGDIFSRWDGDGILPTPDIIVPATDVVWNVTPLSAPVAAGVFTITMVGTQCLNVLEDA